jgi:hypothetical protein
VIPLVESCRLVPPRWNAPWRQRSEWDDSSMKSATKKIQLEPCLFVQCKVNTTRPYTMQFTQGAVRGELVTITVQCLIEGRRQGLSWSPDERSGQADC